MNAMGCFFVVFIFVLMRIIASYPIVAIKNICHKVNAIEKGLRETITERNDLAKQ